MPNPAKLALFFFIYSLPPTLITVRIIPYEYRYESMLILIIAVLFFALKKGFSLHELGIRQDNIKPALLLQLAIGLIVITFIIMIVNSGQIRNLAPPQSPWFYIMYLFLSGPVQEFIYRSVVFAKMDRHTYLLPWQKIALASLNFAWLHAIYLDWIILSVSLLMGIVWSGSYYYKPNYWAISLGHAIIGFTAIWLGLI